MTENTTLVPTFDRGLEAIGSIIIIDALSAGGPIPSVEATKAAAREWVAALSRPVPDDTGKLARIRKLTEAIMFDADAEAARAAILAVLDEPAPAQPVPVTEGVDLEAIAKRYDDMEGPWGVDPNVARADVRSLVAEVRALRSVIQSAWQGIDHDCAAYKILTGPTSRLSPPTREATEAAVTKWLDEWPRYCDCGNLDMGGEAVKSLVAEALGSALPAPTRGQLAEVLQQHWSYIYDGASNWSCSCGAELLLKGDPMPAGIPVIEWRLSQHRADAVLALFSSTPEGADR